jgi:hypothetical protein
MTTPNCHAMGTNRLPSTPQAITANISERLGQPATGITIVPATGNASLSKARWLNTTLATNELISRGVNMERIKLLVMLALVLLGAVTGAGFFDGHRAW